MRHIVKSCVNPLIPCDAWVSPVTSLYRMEGCYTEMDFVIVECRYKLKQNENVRDTS